MKTTKRIFAVVMTAFFAVIITGCSLWEKNEYECIPLPAVDEEIEPDPWKPGDVDDKPIGN